MVSTLPKHIALISWTCLASCQTYYQDQSPNLHLVSQLPMFIYSIMLEVEKKAIQHNLSLTGHCTDSTSNALNALLMLAMPTKYLVEEFDVTYLGLSRPDYFLFAPFCSRYPSIAYLCWDHLERIVPSDPNKDMQVN